MEIVGSYLLKNLKLDSKICIYQIKSDCQCLIVTASPMYNEVFSAIQNIFSLSPMYQQHDRFFRNIVMIHSSRIKLINEQRHGVKVVRILT